MFTPMRKPAENIFGSPPSANPRQFKLFWIFSTEKVNGLGFDDPG
jgi:hypothetical protein